MSTYSDRDDRDPPGHVVATRVVPSRRRPWAVPAILVIALAVLAVGFLGQKPVPPRPPVEPTPTPPPVAMDWTAIPLDQAVFRGALVGLVTSGSTGVLALGQDRTDRHPVVWMSPDGRSWVRHDQPAETFGGGVPDAVLRVGSGFVAAGYHATVDGTIRDVWISPDGEHWTRDPSPSGRGFDEITSLVGSGSTAVLVGSVAGRQVLLSSDDGILWTPITDLDVTLGRAASVAAVIDTGSGYMAVGSLGTEDAIWRSPDGRVWTLAAPSDPSLFAGVRLQRLFRTTTGFLVSGFSDGFGGPSSWESSDGVSWVPDPPASLAQRDVTAVLPLDGGNFGVSFESSTGGNGGLSAWVPGTDPVDVPPPTAVPTDWNRQATVVDGRVLLLAGDPATDPIEGWLGTLVGSGTAHASPSPSRPSNAPGSPVAPGSAPPIAPRPADTPDGPLDWVRLAPSTVFSDDARDVSMAGLTGVGTGLVAWGADGFDAVIWRASDVGHWHRLPASPAMRGAAVRAVVGGDALRLIAVGAILGPDGGESPAAWTSADGSTWTRSKVSGASVAGSMADVVAGPDGFVAVGWRDSDEGSSAAAWTSHDGASWSAATLSPSDPTGTMQAVVRIEAGYVAVGGSQPRDGSAGTGAAWVSPDGRTWTKVPAQAALAPADQTDLRFGGLSISDVVAGGPGLLAVGNQDTLSGPVGAIFTSVDGRSWLRSPPVPMFDGTFLYNVVTWAGGFAVAGALAGYTGGDPVIFGSADGVSWNRIARSDLKPTRRDDPGEIALTAIARYGSDLIGVGGAGGYPGRQRAAVWVGAAAGERVPDHVCPSRVDSLMVLAAMSPADRGSCIDDRGVTVAALVRANEGGCTADVPDELSGCGGTLDLAPIEGGPSFFSTPVDRSLLPMFGESAFSAWSLTFTTGVAGPGCAPTPGFNGVVYVPPDSIRLQCLGVLRLTSWKKIVRR